MAADDIAHLLRRTEFFPRPARLAELAAAPIAVAVESVLDFTANGDPQLPPNLISPPANTDVKALAVEWWLDQMALRPRPLQEKMALFWHGHFVSEWDVVGRADHMLEQNQLYRSQALGNYEVLTQAMALQPAMLLYLSNGSNVKSAPNENFARELLELFTLGVGNYTQDDVVAAARAWTGYNYDWPTHTYEYRSSKHDEDLKTFFGKTANWNGPGTIHEILVDNPDKQGIAARFIARKLWEFLAYPRPAQNIVDELAAAFIVSGLDLKALLRALLNRPEFYSAEAKGGLVRTPTEWAAAILAGTGISAKDAGVYGIAPRMGQRVFDPPNVSGWKSNSYWLTTSALSGRAAFARKVASVWADRYFTMIINMSAEQAVDAVANMFGIYPLGLSSYVPILEAHKAERAASNNQKNTVAALLTLVMLSGEMNVG